MVVDMGQDGGQISGTLADFPNRFQSDDGMGGMPEAVYRGPGPHAGMPLSSFGGFPGDGSSSSAENRPPLPIPSGGFASLLPQRPAPEEEEERVAHAGDGGLIPVAGVFGKVRLHNTPRGENPGF